MFDNTIHIPLRFYTALEKQDRFKAYSTNKRFSQYTDTTHLPSFQIKVTANTASVKIVHVASEVPVSISPTLYFESFTGFYYLIHDGTTAITALSADEYYLDITCGSDHFYSEVFTVGDISDKTILEYYNTFDLAEIDYTHTGHGTYKSKIIFDSTLARPEYVIEEEAVEDGDGNQLITFQRSVKLFKFWFYAPEYIADALAVVSLHDFVALTTHYGMPESETGTIYDFAMTAEWQESKGLAKITCEFRDAPIIKTTCSNPIT